VEREAGKRHIFGPRNRIQAIWNAPDSVGLFSIDPAAVVFSEELCTANLR
jgi:hypothetical protein